MTPAYISHPIHEIPIELLLKIFSYCVPVKYNSISQRRLVMLPSHVCQRWRAIALSTPSLWSYILVTADSMWDPYPYSKLECTRTWLARSEHCPLSIQLRGNPGSSIDATMIIEDALQLLLLHSARWHHFSIEQTQIYALKVPKDGWPLLESLELKYFETGTAAQPSDAFFTAPRLRRLTLNNCRPSLVKIPWNQLTHCEAIAPLWDEAADILRLSPNLESLEVRYIEIRSIPVLEGTRTFQHPCLSTLKVNGRDSGAIRQLLDQISLPFLRELSCPHLDTALISLLSRSACNLVSLQITGPFKFEESFSDLLRTIPGLRDLSISINPSGWVELAEALTLTPDNQLVSGLRSLELRCTAGSEPAHPAHQCASLFAAALQSRWAPELATDGLRFMELRSNFASEAFRKALLSDLNTLVESPNSAHKLPRSPPKRQTVLEQTIRTYGRFDVILDGRRFYSL
ncbi:hypothetical protein HWV62_26688 [Athelia sp. TMB]|nr:hypothetical protein HWV62_26688 [Athelia sp. TMB]